MSCGGGHAQGAAEHDRLSSNTYRRLNLGLAAWAAANLTLLAKGAASHVVTWCSGYAADIKEPQFRSTHDFSRA